MKNEEKWMESKFVHARDGSWKVPQLANGCRHLAAEAALSAYVQAIRRYATGDLVDLGCGRAPLYGVYKEHVRSVFCVDWQTTTGDNEHVDQFANLNEFVDLGVGRFNTAIATDVLEHLNQPTMLFETVAHCLRPGGKLILGVPFIYWIHDAPFDYFRYTKFALDRLVRRFEGLRSVLPLGYLLVAVR
jgi:2-polyprenyl-3-methyl-5-hydroxy-6-metoxy-1,4-benzoquinol methylase